MTSTDPIGLTPEQRTWSNIHAAFARREVWWPPEVDTRIHNDGPCLNCGAEEHAPGCTALLAKTLHDIGLRLDLALIPREEA